MDPGMRQNVSRGRGKKKRKPGRKKTALSQKNILENERFMCAQVKRRNRSIRSKVLKTNPMLLREVVVVNKPKEADA